MMCQSRNSPRPGALTSWVTPFLAHLCVGTIILWVTDKNILESIILAEHWLPSASELRMSNISSETYRRDSLIYYSHLSDVLTTVFWTSLDVWPFLFYKTIKLHETAFFLEQGIWSKLNLCSQAMATQVWLQNRLSLVPFKEFSFLHGYPYMYLLL